MVMRAPLVVALLCVASAPAMADEIVIPQPQPGVGICAPFECGTRLQQVFDAPLFPSAITIESLTFFNTTNNSEGPWVEPTRYRFYLSTTPLSSATITAAFDQNVGADSRLVFDWTVDGFETGFSNGLLGTLTLPVAGGFSFDPRMGNLLLEIRKDSTAGYGDGPIYVDGVAAGASGVALLINTTDPILRRGQGMTIGLNGRLFGDPFDPGDGAGEVPVPEPASLALIGSGLFAAALRRRRRNA
ncbi:MAG TPA: PEP-CTERM sorting domain-containing protein [Vicinamibacterales bacterium]|nr:PEP-CTERM sorting domain-containing protein [Vicinamibacterales bacterium]